MTLSCFVLRQSGTNLFSHIQVLSSTCALEIFVLPVPFQAVSNGTQCKALQCPPDSYLRTKVAHKSRVSVSRLTWENQEHSIKNVSEACLKKSRALHQEHLENAGNTTPQPPPATPTPPLLHPHPSNTTIWPNNHHGARPKQGLLPCTESTWHQKDVIFMK